MTLQDLKNNRTEVLDLLENEYCKSQEEIKAIMQRMVELLEITACTTIAGFVSEAMDSVRFSAVKRTGLRETMGMSRERNENEGRVWNPLTREWN